MGITHIVDNFVQELQKVSRHQNRYDTPINLSYELLFTDPLWPPKC